MTDLLAAQVRRALVADCRPLSKSALLQRVSSFGVPLTKAELEEALRALDAYGEIMEGSQGIQWVPPGQGTISEAMRQDS